MIKEVLFSRTEAESMKLGVFIPNDPHFFIIPRMINSQFPNIHPQIFYYECYKEVVPIIKEKQKSLDGILFGGSAPYDYANYYLKQEIPWDFLDRYSGSVLRAILQASLHKINLERITFDYNDVDILKKIYEEQNLHFSPDMNLSYGDIKTQWNYIEEYNEASYYFHRDKFLSGKSECAITPCYWAAKQLERDHIPVFFSYPTRDTCIETIRRLYSEYLVRKNQRSQIVIISIEMDLPNEYSMFAQNEQTYIQEKMKISSYLYSFAEKISSTVVEVTYRNFLIFTTRSILEAVTQSLHSFEIIEQIEKHCLNSLSVGIGYGETVKAAKINANTALLHSKKSQETTVFVVYADKIVHGPLTINKNETEHKINQTSNQQLLSVSSQSEVSMQNLFKLYNLMSSQKRNTFTIKTLSQALQINRRSVDRMINKLEMAGFAKIIGMQASYDVGRPSRIVQIDLKKGFHKSDS